MFQENLLRRIEINSKIMFGKPVIRGTRIPVETILRKLSQNISINKILQDYPRLTPKDIQAALKYAAESVHGEEVHLLRAVKWIMKFLIDESVEKLIVDWLRDQKYDVIYVAESSPAITDEEVIKIANSESRILITNDKDFGELIFRQGRITQGILLIRAVNEEASNKLKLVKEVLEKARNKLEGNFMVVNEVGIRIRKIYQKN